MNLLQTRSRFDLKVVDEIKRKFVDCLAAHESENR